MTTLLLFIARGGLYLGLFYAFFLLVMRRTTFFRLNRALLLAGSYLCLLLPAFRLRTTTVAGINSDLTMIATGMEPAGQVLQHAFPWQEALLALYIIGALVTLTLYLASALKMGRLIRTGEMQEREDCKLVLLEEDIPSFSWGRKVVISRTDLEENPAILAHELMHVKCRHTLDLLLLLPIQLLFWWNPLVWVIREELQLLHEYEADEGVIQEGIDANSYQLLLVRKAAGEQRFILASEFQHAQLKNRIEMMLRPGSSGWLRWSYLAMIPILAGVMFFCNPARAVNSQASVTPPETGTIPENQDDEWVLSPVKFVLFYRMPSFNGGETDEFSRWVSSRLQDFRQGIQAEVKGSVLVQFTVEADGSVQDVRVASGLREDLDNAAHKAVSSSPRWEPAINANGEPVPVSLAISVTF